MASTSTSPASSASAPITSERAVNKQRACVNCARSKTRCHWLTATVCQRCSKSNLNCTLPEAGPRRKRGKSKRVGALEQKVDSIMNLLAASQQSPNLGNTPFPQIQQQAPAQMSFGDIAGPFRSASNVHVTPITSSLPATNKPPHDYIDFPLGFRVSLVEANQILLEYRTNMLPHFPFITIPSWTAREMLHERPLLLKAIIYACRPQPWPVKTAIDTWFREYFATHVVVKNERSLELLQAMLIFLAWNDWHFFVHANDTGLLHLAVGMIGDMGLNRAPESQIMPSRSMVNESTIRVRGLNMRRDHTHADRRALLGVFYITSIVWTIFRRSEPLEYTDYMEQCCNVLSEANDCPTDYLIIALVRMQHLVLQANKITPNKTPNGQVILGVPHTMAFDAIQRQLEDIVQRLPESVKSNHLLWSHYHTVLIRLYEPIIDVELLEPTNQSFVRTQAIWTCCRSAKSLLELYLTIPGEIFPAFSFAFIAHLSYANLILTHLLFLDDRDWNGLTARESVNYPDLVQRLSDYFETCEQLTVSGKRKTLEDGKGLFLRYAENLRWAKNWYLSRLSVDSSALDTIVAAQAATNDIEFETWNMLFV